MSATYAGQTAQWIVTPRASRISQPVETPTMTPQAPEPTMLAETPAMSLDLPRFFYELEAFFQSAKKIEAALQEERRMNAELRAQLKREAVEQERKLADTQERNRILTEQARKAHELVQNLQAQAAKTQMELEKAREQWRLNHEKAKKSQADMQTQSQRAEKAEAQLAESRGGAERAKMDSDLALHEKETELRTLTFERDGLMKKLRDLEMRMSQMDYRYKTEKDARERIEAYAKNCYQELLKERQRATGRR